VKKMLQAACDASGAQHVVGEVTFPLDGPEQLLEVVAGSLPHNAKLAVFDAGGRHAGSQQYLKSETCAEVWVACVPKQLLEIVEATCHTTQSWQCLMQVGDMLAAAEYLTVTHHNLLSRFSHQPSMQVFTGSASAAGPAAFSIYNLDCRSYGCFLPVVCFCPAVTSNTALVLPIKQLVQLCKDRWVCLGRDGPAAHAEERLTTDDDAEVDDME
jgi:hypothetical protein